MGAVFKAIHFDDPDRAVVLKMVRREGSLASVKDHQRFNKEAALLSRLYHPHIVGFHSFGVLTPDNNPEELSGFYLVMDWIGGKSLKEHIQDKTNDLSFFFQTGLQICGALDYTHSKNIVHRDLKPSNILIRQSKRDLRGIRSVILDFGIARLNEVMQSAGSDRSLQDQRTTDDLIGTPVYMAPEQTPFAQSNIDHRTDLYALGCLFYELLAGRPPFFRGSRIQILKQQARSHPPSLQILRPGLPPMLNAIVFRLLEKKPEDRYQSAFSLYSDLQKVYAFLTRDKGFHARKFTPGAFDRIKTVASEINELGRESSLTQVTDLLDQASESTRGKVIGIQGAVGLGKSKFLGSVKKELQARNLRFASGEFLEYASGIPFHTLAGTFYEYLQSLDSEPFIREELKNNIRNTLGSELSLLGSLIPGLSAFFPELKYRPFNLREHGNHPVLSKVFSDFLRCLFHNQAEPVVFLFDNINKADPLSLKLLSSFVSHTNSLPFILVVTYQPWYHQFQPHLSEFLKKLQTLGRRYLPVVLRPLTREESQSLLSDFFGGARVADQAATDFFFRECQGNPSHILALARKCLILESLILEKDQDGRTSLLMAQPPKEAVRTDSIEQALRKMEAYPAGHWQVLELCSVMGHEVMIRPGVFEPWFPQDRVQTVLKQAEKDGLLYKKEVSEAGQMTSLYRFSHVYLRDVIYQALPYEKKRSIHEGLYRFYEKKAGKEEAENNALKGCYHAFWLADHGIEVGDPTLEGYLAFSGKAGDLLSKNGDDFTGLLIFLKTLQILESHKVSGKNIAETKAWLFSSIGHCYARLNQWDRAHHYAGQSAHYQTRGEEVRKARNFLMRLCLIQGDRDQALGLADKDLQNTPPLGPQKNLLLRLSTGIRVFSDWILPRREIHLLSLRISQWKDSGDEATPSGKKTPGVNSLPSLLRIEDVLFNFRFYQWLPFHYFVDKQLYEGKSYRAIYLRHFVYKAMFWSFLGRYRHAGLILRILMDFSFTREDSPGASLCSLALALVVDYEENRPGSLNLHLQEGLKHLNQQNAPSLFPKAWLLKAFLSVQAGKLQNAESILQNSLQQVGGSQSAILQWGAMQLFVDFISGRRDSMLRHGEEVLRRTRADEQKDPGLYGHLIILFVAFAKGDVHRTRQSFHEVAYAFSGGLRKILIFSFEQDLVSLILCSFPMIFEQENKRKLMRQKEMERLLLWLKKKILGRNNLRRDTFLLLKGKVLDDLGLASCRRYYRKAMKIASEMGHDLISCLSCLWYSQNLEDFGSERPVWLKEAWEISRKRNFTILQKHIEGVVQNEKGDHRSLITVQEVATSNLPFQAFPTSLAFNHLAYLSKPCVRGITYKHSLDKSMQELLRHYKAECVRVLLRSPDQTLSHLCFPADHPSRVSEEDLKQHLEPFINLGESMFVPPVACPWTTRRNGEFSRTPEEGETKNLHPTLTLTLSEEPRPGESQTASSEPLLPFKSGTHHRGNAPMHAYIPVNSSSGNQGVLMVEYIPAAFTSGKVMGSRQELDMFGAQLGLVVERDFFARDSLTYSDQWRMNYAEGVPWLKIWSRGSPEKEDVSCWSLGLALPENRYLLMFCELSGGEEKQRQLISSMIWHHIHIMQIIARNRNRGLGAGEIRDHLNSLLSQTPGTQSLGNIALSFSFLRKGSSIIKSGHFGESRPLILAGTNLVRPFNEVVLSFDHGRDLRYWEVEGTWDELLPLFVCGNSHSFDVKLNIRDVDKLRGQMRAQQPDAGLHQFLERTFPASQLPPYYVAVIAQSSSFAKLEA